MADHMGLALSLSLQLVVQSNIIYLSSAPHHLNPLILSMQVQFFYRHDTVSVLLFCASSLYPWVCVWLTYSANQVWEKKPPPNPYKDPRVSSLSCNIRGRFLLDNSKTKEKKEERKKRKVDVHGEKMKHRQKNWTIPDSNR